MLFGLSESLRSLVEAKFSAAKANSSIFFTPSEVTTIRTSRGIAFQLRYCPTLAKKPTASNPEAKTDGAPQKRDPFEDPPQDLLVAEIPQRAASSSSNSKSATHILVLNKFPIIPAHFILATKANKPQTHALEEDDLEVAYVCLRAWEEDSSVLSSSSGEGEGEGGGSETRDQPSPIPEKNQQKQARKRLFAFFNSGEHSGASQPHRHLQFLPVESIREQERAPGWELLLDLILNEGEVVGKDSSDTPSSEHSPDFPLLQHPSLPITHFAHRLPSSPTPSYLLQTYHSLLAAAQSAIHGFDPSSTTNTFPTTHPIPLSYNLALTTSAMAILPRRAEGQTLLDDAEEGDDNSTTVAGSVSLNGTALAGTLMVKQQSEWDLLRRRPEKLDDILEAIGVPRVQGGPRM
ncbi:uncharacterized protein EI97DRAFT_433938 [Westerdykella ornata]|uniref:Uncharacterized protein n=1 Tax=Westerdykella ornata TaxID=318751 RepID=A0A6A6JHY6_WESOR|nr:uncharacterized protein EI97DRAFT_433938 [Westerdykella ornata]KAF2276007.1 hypothetical protein EI97DRAFT_433938 [Westerdykella ornata]